MHFGRLKLLSLYGILIASVFLFVPGEVSILLLFDIFAALISVYVLYLLFKRKVGHNHNLSTGIIYMLGMLAMMIFGCINYFVVQHIWPSFVYDLHLTNLYWICGISGFGIGYIWIIRPSEKIIARNSVLAADFRLITVTLWFLGFIGTVLIIRKIGYIPILSSYSLSGVRFSGAMSLYGKLWQLNTISAVAAFYVIYVLKTKKKNFYITILVLSLMQLTLFAVRFHYSLVVVSIILIYFHSRTNRALKVKSVILYCSLLLLFNVSYLAIREKSNPAEGARNLSFVQTNVIYFTFNEYVQLTQLISTFRDFRLGSTFINIPISFLPYQIWDFLGIKKKEVRRDASSYILADLLNSQTSIGLRTGIMGEFYVNFGLYGAAFMLLLGLIVGFLENYIRSLSKTDTRTIFLFLTQAIVIYSLVGQIDAIAQTFVYFLMIIVPISIFCSRRMFVPNICLNDC